MKAAIAWTPGMDAELLRRRASGENWSGVAAALSLGRSNTIERGRKLGLEKRAYASPPAPAAGIGEPDLDDDRRPLPSGHPETWGAITERTFLEGVPCRRPM